MQASCSISLVTTEQLSSQQEWPSPVQVSSVFHCAAFIGETFTTTQCRYTRSTLAWNTEHRAKRTRSTNIWRSSSTQTATRLRQCSCSRTRRCTITSATEQAADVCWEATSTSVRSTLTPHTIPSRCCHQEQSANRIRQSPKTVTQN